MPSFPSGAAVRTTVSDISLTYLGIEGKQAIRRLTKMPASGVTVAMMDTLASASAGLSNAALLRYQGLGIKKEIAVNQVLVYDENHGMNEDLIVTFQKEDTLDTFDWRIPAPDAGLFYNGVILKSGDDAVQGARIVAMLNAVAAIVNVGLADGVEWSYVSGYLSSATSQEKRVVPPVANIEEPPAGSPSDDPAETPA